MADVKRAAAVRAQREARKLADVQLEATRSKAALAAQLWEAEKEELEEKIKVLQAEVAKLKARLAQA